MTQIGIHDRLSASGAHRTGWLVSVGLHGSLVLVALILLQQLHLAVQPEPFEWDVAMVQPVEPPFSTASANESPPSPPVRTQPSAPIQRASSSTPVEPVPPPIAPLQPSPAPFQHPPLPAETAPPPPAPAVTAVQPVTKPEPIRNELPPEPHAIVRSHEPLPPKPVADAPAPPPAHSTVVPEPPLASTPPAAAAFQPPPPAEPEPSPPRAEPMQQSASQSHAPSPVAPSVETASAPSPTEGASPAPTAQPKVTKPDDGWLSDLMGKWIQDLEKPYPPNLRAEGVQGKVVLMAILHDDGTMSDVKVSKSSGNVVLDQAAVNAVEKGPPIQLSRPLGRSQRPIKFSISYDLKTVR